MPGNVFSFTLLRGACYGHGKVLDDAVHLVAGFEHEPRKDKECKFTLCELIDFSPLPSLAKGRIPRQPP